MKKTFVAFGLCLAMAAGMVSTPFAAKAAVANNSFDTATNWGVNQPVSLTLIRDEAAYFKFTPSESGKYEFYSYDRGISDPCGIIYNGARKQLAEQDDLNYINKHNKDYNFDMIYYFQAGQTYYLKARTARNGEPGNFKVCLKQLIEKPKPVTPAAPATVKIGKITYKLKGNSYIVSKTAKAKKITVPATIAVAGKTYQVTGIAAKAFKNNKKVTTIVIGSNVTTIGKKAFNGDKKLKKIIVKTKKLSKGSIKNMAKSVKTRGAKLTVKAPKAKKKVYKKIFKKTAKAVKIK